MNLESPAIPSIWVSDWMLFRVRKTCNCCQKKSGNHMWSVFFPEISGKKSFCISSFSLLHPFMSMRRFQRWGRTSTFDSGVEGKKITLSSEPCYFCPFLVNISAHNACSFYQQKLNFHLLPFPADSDILVGSGFSMLACANLTRLHPSYTHTLCCQDRVATGNGGMWHLPKTAAWVDVIQTEALWTMGLSPLSHPQSFTLLT